MCSTTSAFFNVEYYQQVSARLRETGLYKFVKAKPKTDLLLREEPPPSK